MLICDACMYTLCAHIIHSSTPTRHTQYLASCLLEFIIHVANACAGLEMPCMNHHKDITCPFTRIHIYAYTSICIHTHAHTHTHTRARARNIPLTDFRSPCTIELIVPSSFNLKLHCVCVSVYMSTQYTWHHMHTQLGKSYTQHHTHYTALLHSSHLKFGFTCCWCTRSRSSSSLASRLIAAMLLLLTLYRPPCAAATMVALMLPPQKATPHTLCLLELTFSSRRASTLSKSGNTSVREGSCDALLANTTTYPFSFSNFTPGTARPNSANGMLQW
jgi:hypothetical protein